MPAKPIPPPARDGVGASCIVTTTGPWSLLLDFLDDRLPNVGRSEWQHRLQNGLVLNADARPVALNTPCRPGQRLYYFRNVPDEPAVAGVEDVLFQDEHLVVADKPHGLPVTPSGPYLQQTLLVRLKRRLGIETLVPIHRIDRETSGLVCFAVSLGVRDAYHALFRDRAVHKVYDALAALPAPQLTLPRRHRSRLQPDPQAFFREIEVPGPFNSETWITLAEVRGGVARYQLEPLTGRRHQLRVHMNALELPLAGDQLYPRTLKGPGELDDGTRPLQLIARSLAFTDPVNGATRHFESQRALDWGVARVAVAASAAAGRIGAS